MTYQRDPLSVRFTAAAWRMAERAYAADGEWVLTHVPPPGPRALAWMRAHGFEPYERDRWGELRWIRAYKRAFYWVIKWHGRMYGLSSQRNLASGGGKSNWGAPVRPQWETRARDEEGRWVIAVRLHRPGDKTQRIGHWRARREGNEWITAEGEPTYWQSTLADRPWEEGYREGLITVPQVRPTPRG